MVLFWNHRFPSKTALSPLRLPREGGFIGNTSSRGLDQCSQFTSQQSGASVLSCWKQPLGWRTPAVLFLRSLEPGGGGVLAGRVLADLSSFGGTRCCSMVGDMRGSSCDLEAFFTSFQGNKGPTLQVRGVIRDPLASNPELVPSQSPSGPRHGCGSALLLQALWVLGKSLNSRTARNILCWQSGP